ncbi:MAG: TRAP transporter small permease [Otoolea sp.]|nr:TRAP transporter small permease [Clostridiaceae bacterium]MDD6073697.1 TRAP transporter small permease [Clostridium sp.]MDY5483011.1 TRAP transporter small permease [Clostridium sp.]
MEKKKITLKTILLNLDAIITGTTLTLATIIVNLNVLMRYFMKSPLLWAEEVATGLFVWTVFVGSAYAYRKHAHLGVDILVNALPEKIRAVVKVVMDVLGLFVLIMLTYVSVLYVYNTLDKLSNTLRVPSWYVSSAVPIGFGLSLIYAVYFLAKDFMGVLSKKGGSKA